MKKILFPMLAVAALVAAPAAYARPMHDTDMSATWNVLMNGNSYTCFTANRAATPGETKIAGPYATQAKASAALGAAGQCDAPESMT